MPPVVPIWRLELDDAASKTPTSGLGRNCSATGAISCRRCALRKARMKRPLCVRGRADLAPLGKNHGPGEHAEGDKQEKDGFGDRTGLKDEINDFAADKQQQDGRKMHRFRERPC
jgi:hypothetical protein